MALTPDEIDGLRELILAVYGPVTEELLRDLCRCITAAGQISSGDEYKLLLAKSLAGADDVIADTLRRQTDLTDDAVEQLMRWAAEKTAPLEENESLRNIAEAYVKVTRKEVANVLGQLAAADVDGRVYPIKDVYRRTMDYVFREVSSGTKTPEEAVRRATLRLWQRGIRTVDRSDGRTFSVEFMAQRAIMAKMGEMTTAINEKHHDDGGCDGWEISAHSASAPDHEPYQGRQYSDKEYKRLNSRLQRRIGTLSCKHIAWPIKLGVDSPQWTDEQLAEMARENAKGITYEGRHYTQYEATQQQKALENSIRQCKDRIAAAQEEGKLGTFSGKFEFVSESLTYWAPDDEARRPIPQYQDSWEGFKSLSADKYPYGLISPHPRFDYHTHYQQHAKWLWEIPKNRVIINGNPYLVCHINHKLAEQKGIKDGDVVRLFNDRGSCLVVARVTYRLYPETIHAYTSSGIYNPIEYGVYKSWDKGGSINVLTPGRLIGDYVPAMAPYSCNIDIEKCEPDPNYGQGFEHILDEVDKQQLETERPVRTSMEADLLFGEREQWLRAQLEKKEAN